MGNTPTLFGKCKNADAKRSYGTSLAAEPSGIRAIEIRYGAPRSYYAIAVPSPQGTETFGARIGFVNLFISMFDEMGKVTRSGEKKSPRLPSRGCWYS